MKSYPVFRKVISDSTGSFSATPPDVNTCAGGIDPVVAVFALKVTVLIQEANRVGFPTSLLPAE
jgi:hypothetical protein